MSSNIIRTAGAILFLACLALIVAFLVWYLAGCPTYRQIDASSAFVYPVATGRMVIALPGGPHYLAGALRDGCYRLTMPAGETLGEAAWVSPSCR